MRGWEKVGLRNCAKKQTVSQSRSGRWSKANCEKTKTRSEREREREELKVKARDADTWQRASSEWGRLRGMRSEKGA